MDEPIVAWHFAKANRELGHGDRRTISNGAVFHVDDPVLCFRGLHGSLRAIDALKFAPGCVVSRTVHRGTVLYAKDKLVSSLREHIVVVDATEVLQAFSHWCSGSVPAAAYAHAAYAYAAAYAAYAAAAAAAAAHAAAHAAYAYADADAAAYAAYDAERDEQNAKLESMLFELIQSTGKV